MESSSNIKNAQQRPLTVALGALLAVVLIFVACGVLVNTFDVKFDWEGDTYPVDFVNDTTRPLKFSVCAAGDCDSLRGTRIVKPGESYPVSGTVDLVSFYNVQDETGAEIGCFKLDFDARPKNLEIPVSRIRSCP